MGEHNSSGEEIRAFICNLEVGLFRAHVVSLAGNYFAFVINQKPASLRYAKVSKFNIAFESDHEVFETDVAMNDSQRFAIFIGFGMGVCQASRHAAHDKHSQFLGQYSSLVQQLLGEL